MGRYTHLAIGVREDIICMHREGRSAAEIARAIDRHRSTVTRELAQNSRAASSLELCYRAS